MRIAILSWRDTASPHAGGSEVVVDQLASRLVARGHDVVLVVGGPTAAHPYAVVRSGGTYSQYLLTPLRFHRAVGRVDVVLESLNGIPYFAPLWQRAPVVGFVHHVHTEQWGMHFPPPVAATGRWVESSLMPRIYRHRRCVAVSASTAASLGALGFDDVTTIEMGLVPPEVSGVRSPTPRFVVLGRLVPHKRVERALELWERVRPVTGGELVVVGDGPLRARLESMAGRQVRFTGWVDDRGKGAELGAAWLLIHPAHHEGWGTVVMEAAWAGVPTLGYDVDGLRDSVVDGVTGLLATDDDAFVAAWVRLATDSHARQVMADAARARAASFSWDASVDALETVLTEAVADAARFRAR